MHVHKRVDLPDGTYTLTQEEGFASGELNQVGVQQDLDQSPEGPKASASVESEEGSTGSSNLFLKKIIPFTF
jgi:hypothetical protein